MADADEAVFLWINGWVGKFPLFDKGVEWVVSDYLVPVSLALTLLGLWFVGQAKEVRQRHQIGVFVALAAMAMASWAVMIINSVYARVRPFDELDVSLLFYRPTDPSFPSNGAAVSFAIAAAVWGVNPRVGFALLIVAGLYGFARVYAGVHYPLDILGGALIGFVAAILVSQIRKLIEPIPTMVIKAARIVRLA